MPRPPRRGPPQDVTTTPTRAATRNAITADIPPFMLETPPHAPFITTPTAPSTNPGASIVPDARANRSRNARNGHHTPTANGNPFDPAVDQTQPSINAMISSASEAALGDGNSVLESTPHDPDDAKQLIGLRDISSLATWTLSSSKPGSALPQLRHPSPTYFWQSDGPQPHTLTLHFFKLVAIVKMRIYLDYELDESYTPTKMRFFAGMSENGLVQFGQWEVQEIQDPETGETQSQMESVRGWIDISLKGVGGRDTRYHESLVSPPRASKSKKSSKRGGMAVNGTSATDQDELDFAEYFGGDVLKAMVVQVRICENHQNGKDTHVRGFQVFSRDEVRTKETRRVIRKETKNETEAEGDGPAEMEYVGLQPADWMLDAEIR